MLGNLKKKPKEEDKIELQLEKVKNNFFKATPVLFLPFTPLYLQIYK